MALLNRRLIAARRAALGLARYDLAQARGVDTAVIEHIETNGTHDNLQLAAAIQLAGVLGIAIADLLEAPAPIPKVGRGDVAVEALLAEQRRPLSAEDIAHILDWTLRRTLAALRALERRLEGTGQALQRLPIHRYALVPAATALTTAQRRDAGRRQLQRLDVAAARVLHRVVCGPRQDRRWNAYSDDERPHLTRLISLGLVHDTGGQLQLSTELMANLGLRPLKSR